jgi:hypothetical protein
LLANKKRTRTREEHERWVATRESLMSDRENDNRKFGSGRAGGKKGGNKEGRKTELLDKLQALLKQ